MNMMLYCLVHEKISSSLKNLHLPLIFQNKMLKFSTSMLGPCFKKGSELVGTVLLQHHPELEHPFSRSHVEQNRVPSDIAPNVFFFLLPTRLNSSFSFLVLSGLIKIISMTISFLRTTTASSSFPHFSCRSFSDTPKITALCWREFRLQIEEKWLQK